jgi:hypothetical protein
LCRLGLSPHTARNDDRRNSDSTEQARASGRNKLRHSGEHTASPAFGRPAKVTERSGRFLLGCEADLPEARFLLPIAWRRRMG